MGRCGIHAGQSVRFQGVIAVLSFPILVVLLLVLVLGGAYVIFLRGAARDSTGWRAVAWTGCVAGIAAAVLTALGGILSFTSFFDALPFRDALGILAFMAIPAALAGVACGALGLRSALRRPALVGLVLSVFCIVTWFVMESGHA